MLDRGPAQSCDELLGRCLHREGCDAYRKKNAAAPLDEFDPSRAIAITRRYEPFDAAGNIILQNGWDNFFFCPPPSRPAAPRRNR